MKVENESESGKGVGDRLTSAYPSLKWRLLRVYTQRMTFGWYDSINTEMSSDNSGLLLLFKPSNPFGALT